MGLFDSAAVKQLKKDSEFIGGLITQQAYGELPPGTADEMIRSETQRTQLKNSFDAAASENGHDKALKKAVRAAGDRARMLAQLKNAPWDDVQHLAEDAIREMLMDVAEPALDAGFIDGILEKTRFPLTEHNRAAVCAMVYVMLRAKAYEYITYDKPEAVADRFVESHPLRGSGTSFADLQRVVDDVIAVQPACAPYMRGEHVEAESVLLEVAASGGGMFKHGPAQPLLVYGEGF